MKRININHIPVEFHAWIDELVSEGMGCEIVINNDEINHVVVKRSDDGDWSGIHFGKVIVTENIRYVQQIYKPAIVDNKFSRNVDVK